VFVQETKNVNTYEFILKKTHNGLKGIISGQTMMERDTKHSTVLERFWNRKKNIQWSWKRKPVLALLKKRGTHRKIGKVW
jgi:hypothetical protein